MGAGEGLSGNRQWFPENDKARGLTYLPAMSE